jgi:hypothetical protein
MTFSDVVTTSMLPAEPSNRVQLEPASAWIDASGGPCGPGGP